MTAVTLADHPIGYASFQYNSLATTFKEDILQKSKYAYIAVNNIG